MEDILEALEGDKYRQREVQKIIRRSYPELLIAETPEERISRDMEWSGEDLL